MTEQGKHDDLVRNKSCPICGSTDFAWGALNSDGAVYFQHEGKIFGSKERLEGRACRLCGNVQVFLKAQTD
jgi:hypothetical protein